MKTKLAILPVFLFLASIFFSCSKENDIKEEVTKFQNPYDYIGKIHNEGVLDLMESDEIEEFKAVKRLRSSVDNDYAEQISDFIKKESREFVVNKFKEIDPKASISITDKTMSMLNLVSTNKVSTRSEAIATELESSIYVQKADEIINQITTESEAQSLFDKFSVLEEQVYLDRTLSEEDRNLLLMSFAVYKNSFQCWDEFVSENYDEFLLSTEGVETRSARANRFYRFIGKLAKADAVGAIIGGATAFLDGSIEVGALTFGPGGIVATVAGHAVWGAIGSSVGAEIVL